ncbi:MAG: Rpn family recombination-promoting nuclease/putative transposase [Lachnospiraceae bacterium]|nr:Rpn family recombination-promoting nuclease/putative transposase [Lachnospiraceae bacterium]
MDGRKLLEADSRVRGNENVQYRDIIKRLPNGERFVVLAIENQDSIDYEMPWRIMGYDYAEYARQIREIRRRKVRESMQAGTKITQLEAKLGTQDKLSPVWTICFYHGKEPWTGPRSLKDMMDFGDFPAAFNDYHMHLVCANDDGLAENCNTHLGLLLRVLAARGDRRQLETLKHSGEFDNIDEETSRAIAELADMPKLLEHVEKGEQEQGGGYSMCVAIDEMVEEGREEGRDKVNRLNALLLQGDRIEDLKRAVADAAFQRQLFREFGL